MSETPLSPSPTTIPNRMTHAADMLRYAAAVAHEHADNLNAAKEIWRSRFYISSKSLVMM